MKKKLSILLALAITTSLASSVTYAKEKEHGYLYNLIHTKNQGFYMAKNESVKVSWDKDSNNPRFIAGDLSEKEVKNSSEALKYLKDNMDAFNLTHGDFKFISESKDDLGCAHYKFKYVIDNIDVVGSQMIVHADKSSKVYSVNGQVLPSIPEKKYSKDIKVDAENAKKNAEKKLNKAFKKNEDKLYLYNSNNTWVPVHQIKLWNEEECETWVAIVNACDGSIIKAHEDGFKESANATGIGLNGDRKNLKVDRMSNGYYLKNTANRGTIFTCDAQNTKSAPGILVGSYNNTFNRPEQAAAVDVHSNMDKVYNYFKNVHGRESFDGYGSSFKSTVHYDRNYLNAYYNGRDGFIFGDGDNVYAKDFAKALDITAHEFTHAVTNTSAQLAYENQSGALNESFSDVFGILIENRDWTIGEEIVLPNAPTKLMRSMQNPTLYNQPAHMTNYQYLPNTEDGDWGGVHTNSGIPNKAFYNVATSVGMDKAGKIYYRALTNYLHSHSNFQDARDALELSAKDLYGNTEKLAVAKAFYDVGIGAKPQGGGDTTKPTISLKAAKVSVDNPTNNGNFNLKIELEGQNTAKYVRLIENNSSEIARQVVDVKNNGMTLNRAFNNKAAGTYMYTVEVSDGAKTVKSQVQVTVKKANTTIYYWQPNVLFYVGNMVYYNGGVYQCIQTHYSSTYATPDYLPDYWQRVQ